MKTISQWLLCPVVLVVSTIPSALNPEGPDLLVAMAGKWEITVRYEWDGKWITEQGSAEREWVLGGRYLSETTKNADGEVESIRYLYWNAEEGTLNSIWLDAMSASPSIFVGKVIKKSSFVLRGKERFPWSQNPVDVEIAYRFVKDGAHNFVMSVVAVNDESKAIFKCGYRRAGS